MAIKTQPIPEGYNTLTPYITVRGAETAIEFYKNAFNAKEVEGLRWLMEQSVTVNWQ